MIIVRFIGGLGNQMFQYSFYKFLEAKGFIVKADLNDFVDYKLHNGFELERIFELNLNQADKKDINKFKDSNLDIFSKIKRKILGRKKSHKYQFDFSFQDLNKNTNLYLDGYWQAKEFIDYGNIKDNFVFKSKPNDLNVKIIKEMKSNTSISIHVRRGDYLKLKDVYAECTKEYYQRAILFMEENNLDCNFYVFSNDISWCKKNLKFDNSKHTFIEHNTGIQSYEDIRLMSCCKHNIIANSSFSWWGAVLNKSQDKKVICPKNWFVNPKKSKDIFIPNDWILIENY